MYIAESRVNNLYAIASVEKWNELESGQLVRHYDELIGDTKFLSSVSDSIDGNKNYKEDIPGLFKRTPIENVDWYGLQRILLYCLVREFKPETVVETGVYYGGNSVFILNALTKNKKGKLISIDYPQNKMDNLALKSRHPWVGNTEVYESKYDPGFIIPTELKERFQLEIGDSLEILPTLKTEIDLFVHDSEHTLEHVTKELDLAWKLLNRSGIAFVDDIDWSNGFYSFMVERNLFPLLLTDNGKDNLRIRTGLIRKSHRFNALPNVTI